MMKRAVGKREDVRRRNIVQKDAKRGENVDDRRESMKEEVRGGGEQELRRVRR